jgi:hypothetical protein
MVQKVSKKINWSDSRWVSLIVVSVYFFSTTLAITFPFPTMPYTQKYYDAIEAVPVGGAILFRGQLETAGYIETYPCMLDTLLHLKKLMQEKDMRVVIYTELGGLGAAYQADYRVMFLELASKVFTPAEWDALYGTNLVYIGAIPGSRSAMKLFADDIRAVKDVDDYGTSLEDIPIMQDINSGAAFDLVCGRTGQPQIEDYVLVYNVPLLTISSQVIAKAVHYPLITAGQLTSVLGGVVAGAEYERLLGIAGVSTKYMTGIISAVLTGVAIIAITNIRYLYRKSIGQKGVYEGRGTDRYKRGEEKYA